MSPKRYMLTEQTANELSGLLGRSRGGFADQIDPKSRHRANIPRASGGGVPLVIMTVRPNGGYGPGFQATPTLDANGKVVSLGANVAAMIPYQGQGA